MLNNRAFPAVLLAALACAAGTDTAHAASPRSTARPAGPTATGMRSAAGLAGPASPAGPAGTRSAAGTAGVRSAAGPASPAGPAGVRSTAGPASPAGPAGVRNAAAPAGIAGTGAHAAVSARSLSLLSRAVRDRHAPGAKAAGGASTMKSTNWAGYAVTGGTYTSVAANWIEPSVTCTSDGIVGFWVGLDGWGSSSVEQDGTGVDCSKGTPQQFAWWETYPANSVQVYDAPVSAGDQMSSSIVAQGHGRYLMVLTDWTKRWTVRNPAMLPSGQNASAEIVAEAVTSGTDITTLPDFGAIGFTNATINGASLQAADAQPIDMTDSLSNVIATTTDADPNGDFIVNYTGTIASAPLRRAGQLFGSE
jgi:Peptidase A4 family